MDNVTRLLEETQQLLECFSSGTLSPVSSCSTASSEFEENFSSSPFEELLEEFRKLLRVQDRSSTSQVLNFIETTLCNDNNSNCPELALHVAVEENCNEIEVYKALLRAGCDPLIENFEGKTALAVLLDLRENSDPLINENCLVSLLLGEWELRRAATGSVRIFKLIHERSWRALHNFLEQQSDPRKLLTRVEPKFAGISPLHELAAINDVDTVKRLFHEYPGMDLNVKAVGSGNTPFHEAAHMSAVEMVTLLMDLGARNDIKNAAGRIPAHLATEKIQVLMEIHTPTTSQQKQKSNIKQSSIVQSVSLSPVLLKKPLSSKKTADLFVQTAKSASAESLSREDRKLKQIIGFLDQIEKHTDHHSVNDLESILQRESTTGRTILHRYARKDQKERLVNFLKGHPELDAKILFKTIDNSGYTPLHEAALEGSLEVAKILLFGFNDDTSSSSDSTNTHTQTLRFTDPSVAAALTGDTPLHAAASMGHLELVQLLLNAGANREARNIEGKRPVDVVAVNSKQVRKLLGDNITAGQGVSTVKVREKEEIVKKRGPGRPRKYPRNGEAEEQTKKQKKKQKLEEHITFTAATAFKPAIEVAHTEQQQQLPLKEIFNNEIHCILLIRLMNSPDWFILEDQFKKIYDYLNNNNDNQCEEQLAEFHLLSKVDREGIENLPHSEGKLIQFLKEKVNTTARLIPKRIALEFLKEKFNFLISSSSFGYIDLKKLLSTNFNAKSAIVNSHAGVPLKMLKYQFKKDKELANNNNENYYLKTILRSEEPKSPKECMM